MGGNWISQHQLMMRKGKKKCSERQRSSEDLIRFGGDLIGFGRSMSNLAYFVCWIGWVGF